jgi:hypothetical protein
VGPAGPTGPAGPPGPTGTAQAAGQTYQVQYNNSGILAANSHFTFVPSESTLHVDKIDAIIDAGIF